MEQTIEALLLPEINYVTDCNQELRINFLSFFPVLCAHTKMQHDLKKNLQSTEKNMSRLITQGSASPLDWEQGGGCGRMYGHVTYILQLDMILLKFSDFAIV